MRSTRVHIVLAALLVGSACAQAADLPAPMPVKAPVAAPAFSWTGLYLGAHLGYGWSRTTYTDPTLPGWQVINRPDGILGGGQIGYNYQFGAVVLGIEADLSATGIDGTTYDVAPFAGDRYRDQLKWTATVVGRLGYAFDRTLLYVKGGAAFAKADHEYQWIGTTAVATGDRSPSGWTIGGGIEYALAPNCSVRLDYSYMELDKRGVTLVEPSYAWVTDVDQAVHALKVGVNFRPWP